MADAYKVKADTSFPRVLREVDGVEEVEGRAYGAGDYLYASDLNSRDRERAENGDLEHLLEEATVEEVEEAQRAVEYGTFIPEHEAESVILEDYGHEIVPRDQVLELKSAGADAAKEAFEASREDGADERPNITASEVSALNEDSAVLPKDSEPVDEEKLAGVPQPPGVAVGPDKEAAEGGSPEPKKRGRPRKSETPATPVEQPKQEQK